MTVEEAIQTLITIDSGYSPNFVANGHIAMGMAINALEELPKRRKEAKRWKAKAMQHKQRWIPVSERLPNLGEDVLATDSVDMFVAWWDGIEWDSNDVNHDQYTPVVAWMPLPAPYEPQESEE